MVCDVHIGSRDETVTLRAVISTVFSTLEIDAVLAGVVDLVTEATRCHACLIYLVEGDRLVLRAASPVHAEFVGGISMGFDEGVTGWVARTGDVIGVIVLHTAAPREFTEEEVDLLQPTATLVGGAIQDAQLYAEARDRVAALTRLAEVSQRLAAATQHERLYSAATAGARSLLAADLCQLFRLEAAGSELRLVASDPPDAAGPRTQGGALLLELLARERSSRELWPELEGAALLTVPLVASEEQLGLLCVLARAPRRFGPGDTELLRALGDQTAMGLERADLIARLTARDRVKELFDALARGAAEAAVVHAAPAGCDLARPHLFLPGEGGAGAPDWEATAAGLAARLRGRDQAGFFDAGRDGLRAVVLMPDAAAAERVIAVADEIARAERVVLGVSAPGSGVADARQALREAARAAQIAHTLRPEGGALGYEQLGAYKYLVHLRLEDSPRDRHWTAVEALLEHDRPRRTALPDTLEEYLARRRSVADTARTLYIHPNTLRQRLARVERVTGLA